jgi:molybdenum cofactor biosynthesis protein B
LACGGLASRRPACAGALPEAEGRGKRQAMAGHHHGAVVRSGPVACALVTVSDTRTAETDGSGRRMRELLEEEGHRVVVQEILPDDPDRVRARVDGLLDDASVECVITSGGTGVAPRDTTYEAVDGLIEKRLDGFGELFRVLSYGEIGAAAMLSRAVAGVARGTVIAVLPGSTSAVELALVRLLLPELRHMVALVREGS